MNRESIISNQKYLTSTHEEKEKERNEFLENLIVESINKQQVLQVIENLKDQMKKTWPTNEDEYAVLVDLAQELATIIAYKFKERFDDELDFEVVLLRIKMELKFRIDKEKVNIKKLIEFIQTQEPPEVVTPSYIYRKHTSAYRHFSKHYQLPDGSIDWEFLEVKMEARDGRFKYSPHVDWSNPKTWEERARALEKKLEEEIQVNEEFVFNIKSILLHDPAMFSAAKRVLRDPETQKIEWEKIIKNMSPKWQELWSKYKPKSESYYFDKLRKIIEKERPKIITRAWITQHFPACDPFIQRYYRLESGSVDWDTFFSKLGGEYQEKFRRNPQLWEYEAPENQYEDQEEINGIQIKYDEQYYLASVVISSSEQDERKIQNKIFSDLINLAKKGNVLAERQLIAHIKDLIVDWSDNSDREWLNRVQFIDDEDFNKFIRSILYRFDPSREDWEFPAFVFGKLKMHLIYQGDLKYGFSLDQTIGGEDDDRTYGDIIGS